MTVAAATTEADDGCTLRNVLPVTEAWLPLAIAKRKQGWSVALLTQLMFDASGSSLYALRGTQPGFVFQISWPGGA